MNITEIALNNFRNYKRQSVKLCPFINLVVGENAQGKTNLLEAVYLSAVGRSPRTPRDKEMIRFGCDGAKVRVLAKKNYGDERVEVIIDKAVNKRIAIGGLPITRMGELMGVISIVFFSPDELKIIKDAPSDRRRFLDIALSQISKNYFYLLSRYNKIIAQRNKLLKSGGATEDNLSPWDSQLAAAGALIIRTRRGFIKRLSELAAKEHDFLTGGKEELSLSYESVDGTTGEEILANFNKELIACREKDLRLGVTHVGPHKDDMAVHIGGADARKYGSQGQQRTAALSIKLAEVALCAGEKGEPPVLLLDDVMGELDKGRQSMLLSRIEGLQSVITCTHIDNDLIKVLKNHKIITVKSGEIL